MDRQLRRRADDFGLRTDMLDLPVSRNLRFVGRARVERSEQQVDTFDPFSTAGEMITAALNNTDVLPGFNLVYALSDRSNLHAGYSHTVNRPEFRELAPFEFTDVVGGRAVVGNPNLERALIRNVDLRIETFSAPARSSRSVAHDFRTRSNGSSNRRRSFGPRTRTLLAPATPGSRWKAGGG